jgi:hypothetical protein
MSRRTGQGFSKAFVDGLVGFVDLMWLVLIAIVFMMFPNVEYESASVKILDHSVFAVVIFAALVQLVFGTIEKAAKRSFIILATLPNYFLIRSAVVDENGTVASGDVWIAVVVFGIFLLQVWRIHSSRFRPIGRTTYF